MDHEAVRGVGEARHRQAGIVLARRRPRGRDEPALRLDRGADHERDPGADGDEDVARVAEAVGVEADQVVDPGPLVPGLVQGGAPAEQPGDDGGHVPQRAAAAAVRAAEDHRRRLGHDGLITVFGRGNVTGAGTLIPRTAARTGWHMAGMGRGRPAAIVLASALALAGCEDAPVPAPASAPVPTAAALAPAAQGIVLSPQPGGAAAAPAGVVLANDPSAPTSTPLCGAAAREADAIGQALLPRQYADSGICQSFACYDPATATYIGLDGYRHVCR